jgi:NAD(P)-dependent dehydrogenase (short-subunit alcohol dehydrogenase family)
MAHKVVLITGSSTGMGAATAVQFAEAGYDVVVCYKSNKAAAQTVLKQVERKGASGLLVQVDVTSEESVKKMYRKVRQSYKRLDVVVCNAAVDWENPIETASFEKDWQVIVRTKIDGSYLTTKYAIPMLKKSPAAHIIYIVSAMHYKVDPQDPAYCVGTAGIVTLMKCMVGALGKYNIRVNGVGPGSTRGTNSQYYMDLGNTDALWDDIAKKNPLGKAGTPEDAAKTILAVVEEPTGYWNGNIVYVNGGSHIG